MPLQTESADQDATTPEPARARKPLPFKCWRILRNVLHFFTHLTSRPLLLLWSDHVLLPAVQQGHKCCTSTSRCWQAEAGKMKTRQHLRVLRVSSSGHWTNKNTREHIKSRAKSIQGEWLMLSDFCSCPWVLGSTFRSAFADWKCRPRCYDAGTGQGPKALALQVLENLEECVCISLPT